MKIRIIGAGTVAPACTIINHVRRCARETMLVSRTRRGGDFPQ